MPTAQQIVKPRTRKLPSKVIPPGSSFDFDTLPISSYRNIEYTVTVYDSTNDRSTYRKLVGSKKNGGVSYQINSKGGDNLNLALNCFDNATDASLRITNNEAVPVEVCVTKHSI